MKFRKIKNFLLVLLLSFIFIQNLNAKSFKAEFLDMNSVVNAHISCFNEIGAFNQDVSVKNIYTKLNSQLSSDLNKVSFPSKLAGSSLADQLNSKVIFLETLQLKAINTTANSFKNTANLSSLILKIKNVPDDYTKFSNCLGKNGTNTYIERALAGIETTTKNLEDDVLNFKGIKGKYLSVYRQEYSEDAKKLALNDQLLVYLAAMKNFLTDENSLQNTNLLLLMNNEITNLKSQNRTLEGFTDENLRKMGDNGLVAGLCYVTEMILGPVGKTIAMLFVVAMGAGFIGGKFDKWSLIIFAFVMSIIFGAADVAFIITGNDLSCQSIADAQ